MIKDTPVKIIQWFFIGVEKFLLRHFASVKYLNEPTASEDKGTLVLMNHVSFLDGAIMHNFCRQVLKKRFKVMILEEQLKVFALLKYVGGFSVNRKSRNVIESLEYAAKLLDDPKNAVVIFPQGELYSMHLNRIHFENGLIHVLNKTKKPVQVIFAVFLIDYLDSLKPKARIYLQEYMGENTQSAMQDSYNIFYNDCKKQNRNFHKPPAWVTE
ncbi:hypothetical protein C3K47_05400 [Solitalea longa]|uniref:Phospholipid/glycerol acyltransferase domain-containing protein n=1 Tax=Solitalea longa TaxID=2079460 RepID=A0A2S5A5T9_9SPHI|nr:1-acyl-sn-glycerol-3-phosphate acyltransferase [Solitalea longa]POY37960.1 hypothetical protein C3K47_05400 [Solitalea longa]